MAGLMATIDLENSSALLGLSNLKRKQLPFAQALALTRTAQAAQRKIKAGLSDRFEIRNNFIERGVRIQAATKRRTQAAVFWRAPGGASRRGFADTLARQETGGIKRPRKKTIALPRGIKRGAGGRITKGNQPGRLLERKNVFIAEVRGGAAILRRVGKSGRPKLLYFLTPRAARIKERFEFRETATRVASRVYRREFGKAFARALATKKG